MNYLSVENISKSYGERALFKDVTFGIEKGQKIAFIAKNGSGKTTLLKILAGTETPETGNVTFRKDITISFLSQEHNFNPDATVRDIIYGSNDAIIQTIKHYNDTLSNPESNLHSEAFEKMNELNAWEKDVFIQEVLSKLRLSDITQPIKFLSGGQVKRIALAEVIIQQPDFLILDEPTNHLDIGMIEWLEDYLSKQNVTLFMVTHDRYFLDNVCNEIIELDQNTLFRYKGKYEYFLEKRAHRYEVDQATIDKAKNTLRKELDWVRRQPKARGTKAKARVDAFYDVKDVASQRLDERELDLEIRSQRLGTKIIELHRIAKQFGDIKILNDFSYTFKHKEKVGIVGENGTGKTTFLNIITGIEQPDKGKVVQGETVVFGHYKQEGMKFDENKKVIDVIKDVAEIIPMAKGKTITAAQLLERFLFPRDMHYQFIRKLSGGEKRRLYLLTILMNNPNFLILDEPTNDLDIFTINALEEYLEMYDGCLLVVSHDRYFMNKMVHHTFVFEGEGEVTDIIGNYEEYRIHRKEKSTQQRQEKREEKQIQKEKEKTKLSYKERVEFEQLEKEIEHLEQKKSTLTEKLSSSDIHHEELLKVGAEIEQVIATIETKSNRWLELAEFV
ncbi:MAG: ABC-F family ATP-binding cassette domain-containing protein [Bacteroidia bacterium]